MEPIKREMRLFTLLLVLILNPVKINAQLIIDAEIRNRFELRSGYRSLVEKGSTPAGLIWQRTRIILNYETDNFKLRLTPQDVRLWGDELQSSSTGVFGDEASLELYEGFAELKVGCLGWISVGRQELNYDNQRLLANRNWNNNGLTYDAVLIKMQAADWSIHLGGTWNNLDEAASDNLYPPNRIKNLNFLWVNREYSENLSLSFLHLATGVTQTDSTNTLSYKQTTGFYTTYKKEGLSIWGEAYYQYGKTNSGKNVRAFLIALDVGYGTGNIKSGIGVSYLSGNNKIGHEQGNENLFDILYGARHRFYGYLDYFGNFPTNTNQGGLADYYLFIDYQLSKSVSVRNIGHYFRLAQANSTTPDSRNLGYENDLILKYKFSSWGTLECGYLFHVPTETLETIQGVENAGFQQFAYIQLTLTPTLFKLQNPTLND